jgi:flagellar biosynthesis protein FlhG
VVGSFSLFAFLSEWIMSDQATELRLLARQFQRPQPTGFSPQIVLFCSGKGGTGVTSCAVNVAQALTERGQRVLLMDGAWERADIGTLMNLHVQEPWSEILAGKRTLHECFVPVQAGLHVLPGFANTELPTPALMQRLCRMLQEIQTLGRHVDYVIIDGGTGNTPVMREYWQIANTIVNVCTPQSMAMMDCYGLIKVLYPCAPQARLVSLINQAADQTTAQQISAKLQEAAWKFCQLALESWPGIPADDRIRQCDEARQSWLSQGEDSITVQALNKIIEQLQQAGPQTLPLRNREQLGNTLAPVWPTSMTA